MNRNAGGIPFASNIGPGQFGPNACRKSLNAWPAGPLHAVLVVLFYSILYVVFFSPVVLSGRLLAPGDAMVQSVPAFYAPRTLWTPLLYSGFPAAADPTLQTWYPLSLLFSIFPDSWNSFILSAYVLGSSFMYGYVFLITRSRFAGLVGGVIYGMSGFMMVHLGHTSVIHAVVWMPLLIWALEKLHDRFAVRWFLVACAAVACDALAGHPQMLVYTLGMGGVYTFVRGLSRKVFSFRYYGLYGVIVALGLGLAAIQLIPSAELASLGPRARMSFADFVSFSLHPYETIRLVFPSLFGGLQGSFYQLPYFGSWNLVELTGYTGLLSLMLTGIGVVAHRKTSLTWLWFGTGLFAFLLTLGDYTPLARLMYYIPVYNKFRAPARHFIEMIFAVSVLSGLGVVAVQKQRVSRDAVLKTILVGIAVMGAGLAAIFVFSAELQAIATKKGLGSIKWMPWSNPAVGIPLAMFVLAGFSLLLWSRQSRSRFRQLIVVSALVVDLGSFGGFHDWRYGSLRREETVPATQVAQRYRALLAREHQRMVPIRGALGSADELPPNLSGLWGVPSASGYGPLVLSRVNELLSLLPHGEIVGAWSSPQNRNFDVMGVRYVFLPKEHVNAVPFPGEKGISWSQNDLSISLGYGCGSPQPASAKIDLPVPFSATSIGIVSAMACSPAVPDQLEIVRILATDIHGKVHPISLRAGRDTSEWAFDCRDVLPRMKHRRAQVYLSFPVMRGTQQEEGHRYVAHLPLGGERWLKQLELQWVGPSALIDIQKITLFDEKTGQSYPVSLVVSDLANPLRWRLFENIGDISVYENLRAMPRVWLVPEVASLKPEEVLHAVKTSLMPDGRVYDPSRIALVEQPFSFNAKTFDRTGSAHIVHLSNNNIEIHTNSASPSFLVLSDVYYPGWEATIDGNTTRLFKTNYVLRGAMIPAGGHVVRFKFRPRSLYWGAGISIGSLLLLLGLTFTKISTKLYGKTINNQ